MLLNLAKPDELAKARTYFDKLVKDADKIELRKIAKKRTVLQNSYLHVLFTLWGLHFGYTVEESKTVVKNHLGYSYEKNGQYFFVQTSGMDTKELTTFIDKFRNWSSSEGCYLPTPEEYKLRNFDYSQEIQRAEIIQNRYSY